jgi:superfamily II DNA helicase RecQ
MGSGARRQPGEASIFVTYGYKNLSLPRNFYYRNMQIKLFTIPIISVNDYNEELNLFLRTNKIIEIEKQLIQTSDSAYWCIYISYITSNSYENTAKEKIDYIKVLDPAIFARFSKLREIRKKIASDDGVSAFVVFTDAELAEIAKLPELSTGKLKTIKGIGDKKAEKYGEILVKMFNTGNIETGGQPY